MELNEALKALGYEVEDGKEVKLTDLKKWHEDTYVGINVASANPKIRNSIIGEMKGGLETTIKRGFTELGVDFDFPEDQKDKVLDLMIKGDNSGFTILKTNMDKLKVDATKDVDEKYKALEIQFNTLEGDHNTIKGHLKTAKTDLKEKNKDFDTFKSTFELKGKESKALDSSFISEDFESDPKKRARNIVGFMSEFKDKYQWELDPNKETDDGLKITFKTGNSKGERVAIDAAFPTLESLYKKELDGEGMLKKANTNTRIKTQVKTIVDDPNVRKSKSEGHLQELLNAEKK